MPLFLTEQDITDLLTMQEAIEALDAAFKRQAEGLVINQPRRRLFMPHGTFHSMVAADLGSGMYATKVYSSFRPKTRFHVMLYSADNGDLLAMMEADRLGQIRTGAATGLATRYLARRGASHAVGMFGTGWQAESQLEAVCAAVPVAAVRIYGRDAEKSAAFCHRMSQRLGVPAAPAADPREAVEGCSVVITATSSAAPVFEGKWLETEAHVNAVGSNLLMKREIDDDTVSRASMIVVDSIEQAKIEAGDLLPPFERRLFRWEEVVELSAIAGAKHPGRTSSEQITLFKSNGIALEDLAVAAVVYGKAMEQGRGVPIGG